MQLLQVNPDMVERLEKAGLSFAAKDETGKRMEVCFFFNPSKIYLSPFAANSNPLD